PPFPTPAYEVARTGQEATRLVAQLQEFPTLALDCETTGLDPLQHRIRLVQVAAPTLAALFDLDTIPVTVLEPLFVADREFLVHNALFDVEFLARAGLPWPAQIFDTMLAVQLLTATADKSKRQKATLEACAECYLHCALPKEEQRSDWEGGLSEAQLSYAA